MKAFLKFILITISTVILFDKLLLFSLNHFPNKQHDRRLEKAILGENNPEILILGSSLASRNIIAKQIEDSIGKTCYNYGYPGSNVEFHEFILKTLISSGARPEILLLVVDYETEFKDSVLSYTTNYLYPLVGNRNINEEICIRDGKSLFLTRILASYRIRENFPLNFILIRPNKLEILESNGSSPLNHKSINWPLMEYTESPRFYSRVNEVEAYRGKFIEIIDSCAKYNIKMILTYPPRFSEFNESFKARIDELSGYSVDSYIYNVNNEIYRDRHYFYDAGHLNRKGAVIFTNELIQYLRSK